jgi:HSP20 family protein
MMYNPLIPVSSLQDEFDHVFDKLHDQIMNAFGHRSGLIKFMGESSYPKCNVRTDKNDMIFDVAIPYHSEDDIKISIEDNVLSISGTSPSEMEDSSFVIREIPRRSFVRSWQMPTKKQLKEENIEAECKNGLLTIRVKDVLVTEPPEKKKLEIKLKK